MIQNISYVQFDQSSNTKISIGILALDLSPGRTIPTKSTYFLVAALDHMP
ncbi:MAG TPA: hypothetical protein VGO47_10810 [Chlamydiales bacterium]|jgi:hypothetical protein|nr:hypothetical protein [Chlamydiales bacterium]